MKSLIHTYAGLILATAATAVFLNGCDIGKSDADPDSEFSKVYDNPDMNLAFYPVDAKQTSDGGFMILSVYTDTALSTFPLIHLLRTDKTGKQLWEIWVDRAYTSAIASLVNIGGAFHLVCMDAVNQETRIMRINENDRTVSEVSSNALKYPLYCMQDSQGDLLVLNFDRIGRYSVLTKYTDGFDEIWSRKFNIVDDVKYQIETHLEKTGRQFPFFIGQVGTGTPTHYYVNCFFNYTMTMLIVNAPGGDQSGILYTYQDDAALSSATSIDGSRFAITRYHSGDNFVNPSLELNLAGNQSITDFEDFSLPELAEDAPVRCLHQTLNGKDVVVFASQTRTNQVALYFYSATDGELQHVKFINEKYPVFLTGLEFTKEEGLALLLQTYLIGRFKRINLVKLSPDDLKY